MYVRNTCARAHQQQRAQGQERKLVLLEQHEKITTDSFVIIRKIILLLKTPQYIQRTFQIFYLHLI